jgi:hypothetical protein
VERRFHGAAELPSETDVAKLPLAGRSAFRSMRRMRMAPNSMRKGNGAGERLGRPVRSRMILRRDLIERRGRHFRRTISAVLTASRL